MTRILIVAATAFEIAPLQAKLDASFSKPDPFHFEKEDLHIHLLITGIGLAYTAYALGKVLTQTAFDLVINIGVAGAFDRTLKIGEVVHVISERFGDLGIEEADGSFTDMHELGLIEAAQPPFKNGVLINQGLEDFNFLPKVAGLTVHKVHGYKPSIDAIQKKYSSQVESMEGAAFFLACALEEVSFLQIRAISNYVESRNKDNWNLPLAIQNLNDVLWKMLEGFIPEERKEG